ncbi:MAG: indole-3-glycerol phosphate synthase TrpC [Thermomicrobiales bacterium]|nr:indole-3-glycerol phosphate synthase TrpC [Thermomicrobiales bacterium]
MRETGTYLDRILVRTAETVATSKAAISPAEMARMARATTPAVPTELSREQVTVIAEFKRASPSKGVFPVQIDPESVANAYIEGGVAAISCLTDAPFFQGSLDDLDAVVATSASRVPVLRKDFTIDTYQIDEARAHGASLILLIVAALDDAQLREYRLQAEELGMAALVEVHDEAEAERAVASGASLIGINNRDLRSFVTDLATTELIAPMLPANTTIVGESGIFTVEDVTRMAAVGVDAVLVGESLILQQDRAAAVRALAGVEKR